MKRMLYISAFPPNHLSGGQTYSFNALSDLSKKYKIDLIYFDYADHKPEKIDGVRIIAHFTPSIKGCAQLPIYYPVFTRRFSYDALKKIKYISSRYDVLYFDFIQTATYSLFIKHPNKVVRCHDILGQKYQREKSKLLPWVKLSENKILHSVQRIFVPSYKDVEVVKKLYGLDATYTNEYLTEFSIPDNLMVSHKFLFFGLWSRYENLSGLAWFIENVVAKNPDFHKGDFAVMGGGLSDDNYQKYLKPYDIKYLGYVKDSYSEIVKYAAVIVPVFEGAGIKVKVLDAFNTGTPVIGTEAAFEGIRDLDGLTYRANTSEEFVKMIHSIPVGSKEDKVKHQQEFLNYYNNRHLSDFL